MTAPTPEEIKKGYDGITEDGPAARITAELSVLAVTSPEIRDTLNRMLHASAGFLARERNEGAKQALLHGLLAGALVYGLHLGLHIGEARAEYIRKNR